MLNIFKTMILKHKLKKNGFKWITVHKDIIQKYKYTTKNNKKLSNFQIEVKLNREYYAGKMQSKNDMRNIIHYGYLRIVKDNKRNLITDVFNSSKNRCGRINFETKDKITEIYMNVFGGVI